MGAKVVTMSDSNGWIYDENGINLAIVKQIKEVERKRIKEYLNYVSGAKYIESNGVNPTVWSVKCDVALPCATQNELDYNDAVMLVNNGVTIIGEGANMPSSLEAINHFIDNGVIFAPAKAANAGGVATSGLEMSQNSIKMSWSFEEVDGKLKNIMENIFDNIY